MGLSEELFDRAVKAVSYTHLDVYKRQSVEHTFYDRISDTERGIQWQQV